MFLLLLMQADILSKLIVDLLLTPPPPRTRGGIDEHSLEASATTALLLSEEGADGIGNEGRSTSTEVGIEETSRILKMFVHDAEDDAYAVKATNSVLKLNLVAKVVAIGVSFCQASNIYRTVKEEIGMSSLGISHVSGLHTASIFQRMLDPIGKGL